MLEGLNLVRNPSIQKFYHFLFLVDSGEHYSEDEVAAQDRNFSLSESSEEESDEDEEEEEEETNIKSKGKVK